MAHILTLTHLQTEGRLQRGDRLHSSEHGYMHFEYARDTSSFVAKLEGSEQRIVINGCNFGPDAFTVDTPRQS